MESIEVGPYQIGQPPPELDIHCTPPDAIGPSDLVCSPPYKKTRGDTYWLVYQCQNWGQRDVTVTIQQSGHGAGQPT